MLRVNLERSVDLLRALTRALEILASAGDETSALTESFDFAARAFGAEKALLLGVIGVGPGETIAPLSWSRSAPPVSSRPRSRPVCGVCRWRA